MALSCGLMFLVVSFWKAVGWKVFYLPSYEDHGHGNDGGKLDG